MSQKAHDRERAVFLRNGAELNTHLQKNDRRSVFTKSNSKLGKI